MRFFVERIPFDPALSAPRRREMDGPVLVPEGQGVVFRVRTERNSEDPFRRGHVLPVRGSYALRLAVPSQPAYHAGWEPFVVERLSGPNCQGRLPMTSPFNRIRTFRGVFVYWDSPPYRFCQGSSTLHFTARAMHRRPDFEVPVELDIRDEFRVLTDREWTDTFGRSSWGRQGRTRFDRTNEPSHASLPSTPPSDRNRLQRFLDQGQQVLSGATTSNELDMYLPASDEMAFYEYKDQLEFEDRRRVWEEYEQRVISHIVAYEHLAFTRGTDPPRRPTVPRPPPVEDWYEALIRFVPILGELIDAVEFAIGRNIFSGEPMSGVNRAVSLGTAIVGLIPVIGRVGTALTGLARLRSLSIAGRSLDSLARAFRDFRQYAAVQATRRLRHVFDAMQNGRLSNISNADLRFADDFLQNLHDILRERRQLTTTHPEHLSSDDAQRILAHEMADEVLGSEQLRRIGNELHDIHPPFRLPDSNITYRHVRHNGVEKILTCWNPCTVLPVYGSGGYIAFLRSILGRTISHRTFTEPHRLWAYLGGIHAVLSVRRGMQMQEITDYLRDIYRLYRGARNSRRVPGGRQRHDQIFEMIFKFSSSPVDDATVRRMLVELSSSGNNMVGALWTLLFIDRANAWDLIRSVEVSNVVGSGSQTRNRIYDLVFRDNNRFEFKNWSGTIGTVDMQDQVLRDLLRGPLRDTFYLFSGRLRQRFADDASFYTWFRDAVNDAIADPATASRYRPDQLNSIVDNWRAVDSPPSGESNLPLRVMIVEDPSLYRSPGPSPIDPIAQYLQNR